MKDTFFWIMLIVGALGWASCITILVTSTINWKDYKRTWLLKPIAFYIYAIVIFLY